MTGKTWAIKSRKDRSIWSAWLVQHIHCVCISDWDQAPNETANSGLRVCGCLHVFAWVCVCVRVCAWVCIWLSSSCIGFGPPCLCLRLGKHHSCSTRAAVAVATRGHHRHWRLSLPWHVMGWWQAARAHGQTQCLLMKYYVAICKNAQELTVPSAGRPQQNVTTEDNFSRYNRVFYMIHHNREGNWDCATGPSVSL